MATSPNNVIPDFPIIVSDYLEKNATDAQRKQGLDIADFCESDTGCQGQVKFLAQHTRNHWHNMTGISKVVLIAHFTLHHYTGSRVP